MPAERRDSLRIPDSRLITEIVHGRPDVAVVVNISKDGLYTVKATRRRHLRGPRQIQLEIPVPEASESIWAVGEIVFERVGLSCVGCGIRLLDMANHHRQLLDDLVSERRKQLLSQMLRAAPTHPRHTTGVPEMRSGSPIRRKSTTMLGLPVK